MLQNWPGELAVGSQQINRSCYLTGFFIHKSPGFTLKISDFPACFSNYKRASGRIPRVGAWNYYTFCSTGCPPRKFNSRAAELTHVHATHFKISVQFHGHPHMLGVRAITISQKSLV